MQVEVNMKDTISTIFTMDYGLHRVSVPFTESTASFNLILGAALSLQRQKVIERFTGCVHSVHIDGRVLPLNHVTVDKDWVTSAPKHVLPGCMPAEVCLSQPCPSNSTCVDEWESYQ